MVDFRLKPLFQVEAEKARREEQRRLFHRNQAVGLLMAAGAVVAYWLWRAPAGWVFPAGWWRLW